MIVLIGMDRRGMERIGRAGIGVDGKGKVTYNFLIGMAWNGLVRRGMDCKGKAWISEVRHGQARLGLDRLHNFNWNGAVRTGQERNGGEWHGLARIGYIPYFNWLGQERRSVVRQG